MNANEWRIWNDQLLQLWRMFLTRLFIILFKFRLVFIVAQLASFNTCQRNYFEIVEVTNEVVLFWEQFSLLWIFNNFINLFAIPIRSGIMPSANYKLLKNKQYLHWTNFVNFFQLNYPLANLQPQKNIKKLFLRWIVHFHKIARIISHAWTNVSLNVHFQILFTKA